MKPWLRELALQFISNVLAIGFWIGVALLLLAGNAHAETKSFTAEATTVAGPDYLIPPKKSPPVIVGCPGGFEAVDGRCLKPVERGEAAGTIPLEQSGAKIIPGLLISSYGVVPPIQEPFDFKEKEPAVVWCQPFGSYPIVSENDPIEGTYRRTGFIEICGLDDGSVKWKAK